MREGGRVWVVGYDVVLEECDLIVMRDAGNEFGPVGCEHISAALRELTGLHELNLSSTCLHDFGCCGACVLFVVCCSSPFFCFIRSRNTFSFLVRQ